MKRRGTVFVVVLSMMSLAAAMAIAGLLVSRTRAAENRSGLDAAQAMRSAASGLEAAAAGASANVSWRNRVESSPASSFKLGSGTVSVVASDPADDAMDVGSDDPVDLTSTALVGSARRIVRARLAVDTGPVQALGSGLFCLGNLSITDSKVACSMPIGAGGSVWASRSSVDADVYAGTTITGAVYTGATRPGASPPSLGSFASVLAEFVAIGTSVNRPGDGKIKKILLAPATNPLGGGTNSQGVYVMDCAGASVEIIDSRINATLVLLNAGASTIISGSVLMDPPTSGWPALLVDGALALEAQSSDLNESLTGNLNPPGSSYQGSSDADTTDQYPSEINGIVMVSGALTIRNAPTINGWIFAERAVSVTSATLVIRAVTAMSGPPGFRPSPGFKISPGGVVRVVE